MKTAIIYSSTHGTTAKVAAQLSRLLEHQNIVILNLKENSNVDLVQFDTVIIGGSIHAGQIQMRIRKFCRANLLTLLEKKVGLFMCGMNQPEFEKEFTNAYPALLAEHAVATCLPGGEFLFEKMNFFQRAIVKKNSGIKESVSHLDEEKVQAFANRLI